jgi:SAM-dependent methyltransferase
MWALSGSREIRREKEETMNQHAVDTGKAIPMEPSSKTVTSAAGRFVSFLLPYIDRGQGPVFHWVMLMQAASFQSGELVLIGDDRYFQPPPPWVPLPWDTDVIEFDYCFHFPSQSAWKHIPKYSLSRKLFDELARRSGSMLGAFRMLLTEDYAPLREALTRIFEGLCRTRKPEAVLTWCHVPSLKLAAAQFDIPVIHNELGPLRSPHFQGTIYFDFKSVNGLTSAADEGVRFCEEAKKWSDFQPLPLHDIRALLAYSPHATTTSHESTGFKTGVALQVEDDSNMLAFANGLDNFHAISLARGRMRPDEVLIRPHPCGYATYSGRLGIIDDSPDAVSFLRKCQEVVTINSSVAFECLLYDKPVRVLGDSPAATLSAERAGKYSKADRLLWLNYLFCCYLVPASFLFDVEYYRWRLSKPTLREIYEKHLQEFRRRKSRIKPWAGISTCQLAEKEASARQAVALDQGSIEALRLLAGLAQTRKHFAEAVGHYEQIAKQSPNDIDAILGQAECARMQNRLVLAELLSEEADQLRTKLASEAASGPRSGGLSGPKSLSGNMGMTKEELVKEIEARKPWYQRIAFDEFGVTTTDTVATMFDDPAPDNQIDGLGPRDAAQMRPLPKWKYIKSFLPDVQALEVLEVGSKNGFFSFEFAKMGARQVVGIDENTGWIDRANWCKSILGYKNVSFHNYDFMVFDHIRCEAVGFLQSRDTSIPIPRKSCDLIFCSAVINHMLFPLFAIYKMLSMARKWVIIDFPVLKEPAGDAFIRMEMQPDGYVHAFLFNKEMLNQVLLRMGIPSSDITFNYYNGGNAITAVINTANMRSHLYGA